MQAAKQFPGFHFNTRRVKIPSFHTLIRLPIVLMFTRTGGMSLNVQYSALKTPVLSVPLLLNNRQMQFPSKSKNPSFDSPSVNTQPKSPADGKESSDAAVCRLLKEAQGGLSSQRVQLSQLCDLCAVAPGQMVAWPKDQVQEGVPPVTQGNQASLLLHTPLAAVASDLSWTGPEKLD